MDQRILINEDFGLEDTDLFVREEHPRRMCGQTLLAAGDHRETRMLRTSFAVFEISDKIFSENRYPENHSAPDREGARREIH